MGFKPQHVIHGLLTLILGLDTKEATSFNRLHILVGYNLQLQIQGHWSKTDFPGMQFRTI